MRGDRSSCCSSCSSGRLSFQWARTAAVRKVWSQLMNGSGRSGNDGAGGALIRCGVARSPDQAVTSGIFQTVAFVHEAEQPTGRTILGSVENTSLRRPPIAALEHFPNLLNRAGFPKRGRSDSSCVLAEEAGMHGEGVVG